MNPPPDVRSIFGQALDIESAAERAAFLDEACGADTALRAEVESLLAAIDKAGNFMKQPAALLEANARAGDFLEPPAPPVIPTTIDRSTGPVCTTTMIGPYRLLEPIGEGGFGVVYRAEQTEPVRRKVALKVLKPGMDSRQVVARFEAERQALALMDHPNIARVFDGGVTPAGRPYFVMELVRGVPITEFCDQHHWTPRQRLELFVSVCRAVQHAHQKGIIHRDLKPSNVLVSLHDATPLVKVIDFGLAKALGQELTDKSLFTGCGQMLGTPLYMSPEQTGRSGLDVDTRTDVYSLGVLLYELLTGATPLDRERFRHAGYDEIGRIVREEEPVRPSARISTLGPAAATVTANRRSDAKKLTRLLRGEMDWVVMKALEKDRNRRYETANGFAMDVQRYLADEPVLACPPSAGYRLRKFARRNKGRLAAAMLVVCFLASLGGVAGWTAKDRADRAHEAALEQAKQQAAQRAALETDVGRDLDGALALCRQNRLREASAVVDHAEALTARGGADEDLARRVAGRRKDVDMASRLEAIRLETAATFKDGHFDWDEAAERYAAAFRDYDIAVDQLDPGEAAARLAASAIREQLVTALDEWLIAIRGRKRERLLAVLARADADPWRRRLRIAFVEKNARALRELAGAPEALVQPPGTAVLMGRALHAVGEIRLVGEFLRRAQWEHPDDFWLNFDLGAFLMDMPRMPARAAEAEKYLRAALGLRPNSPEVLVNLGTVLHDQGDLPGAVAAFEKAIALRPDSAKAHYNLGNTLHDQGDLPGALAAYRKAIACKPDDAAAHGNLGGVLRQQGDLPGAVAAYRKAIALKPDDAVAHSNLGSILRQQDDLPGALTVCLKAVALNPDYAEAHLNLGFVLQEQGEFARAVEELRRGHELGSRDPRWRLPSAQWLRQSQRLLELDGRLSGVLAGKATPANAGERIELAQLSAWGRRTRTALRCYEEAFTAQPTLLAVHRYKAACTAACAGCGRGNDAVGLDDKERTRLRRLALCWLCADLEAQGRLLDKGPAGAAANVARSLQGWLTDRDLAGVREPEQRTKLPPEEQHEWRRLWEEVAAQVARARAAAQVLAQAHDCIGLSQWDKAAAEYARADLWARPPGDDAFARACLFLIQGDGEGYNRFCQGMIQRAAPAEAPYAYVLARICAMARRSPVDPARVVEWANQAVARGPSPWNFHVLGLAQFRAGQFDQALQSFTRANVKEWNSADLNWFGLALVHHRLGRPDEARRCLDRGLQWLEREGPPSPGRPARILPQDWLEAQLLRREAEETLR